MKKEYTYICYKCKKEVVTNKDYPPVGWKRLYGSSMFSTTLSTSIPVAIVRVVCDLCSGGIQ